MSVRKDVSPPSPWLWWQTQFAGGKEGNKNLPMLGSPPYLLRGWGWVGLMMTALAQHPAPHLCNVDGAGLAYIGQPSGKQSASCSPAGSDQRLFSPASCFLSVAKQMFLGGPQQDMSAVALFQLCSFATSIQRHAFAEPGGSI